MKFLVTGGAGFIGSHITERLLKEGHFVRVLDNFSSGKDENLAFTKRLFPKETVSERTGTVPERTTRVIASGAKQSICHCEEPRRGDESISSNFSPPLVGGARGGVFDLLHGDIRDKATCDKACSGIDYVLHQAALRSVPKSMKDPESYNDVNINGTLYMLQAAAKNKVKRFVLASSSSVYGDTSKFPEQESDYPLLISPYALSKLAGEYYCRIFSAHFGLETIALRYFNVFGPRQALDDEYAVVIPKFIHSILHDEQPPIFGTGKQSRDFTFIDNVVEANILAAIGDGSQRDPSPCFTGPVFHSVFNVAAGQDNTVLHLLDLLNKIIGKNIKPNLLPVRAGDVFRTCADISEIKEKLGYNTKVDFEEGLRRTVEWFKAK